MIVDIDKIIFEYVTAKRACRCWHCKKGIKAETKHLRILKSKSYKSGSVFLRMYRYCNECAGNRLATAIKSLTESIEEIKKFAKINSTEIIETSKKNKILFITRNLHD